MSTLTRRFTHTPPRPSERLAPRRPSLVAHLKAALAARKLDRALAAGDNPGRSSAMRLRVGRLTSERHRKRLADAFDRVVEDVEHPPAGPSPKVPVRGAEVREARAMLLGLAIDLRADGPVHARGVAKAELLLTDADSPLYTPSPEGALWEAAEEARNALVNGGRNR
jgi:hypothetical protein